DLLDLVREVRGRQERHLRAGAGGAEGAALTAVDDLRGRQVIVLHGGDVEVAAAQDRDGEGEVLRGGAVVELEAPGAAAEPDPVPAPLHGAGVEAVVGDLGDGQ